MITSVLLMLAGEAVFLQSWALAGWLDVRSLGPDRFTESACNWDEARRKALAIYETYYHVGH